MTWSLLTPWLTKRRAAWRQRAAPPGELLYVALGDSAAQGLGTSDLDASDVGLLEARLHRVTEFRRGRGIVADFLWDQFHPSARGYRVWESAFATCVTRRAARLTAVDPRLDTRG